MAGVEDRANVNLSLYYNQTQEDEVLNIWNLALLGCFKIGDCAEPQSNPEKILENVDALGDEINLETSCHLSNSHSVYT